MITIILLLSFRRDTTIMPLFCLRDRAVAGAKKLAVGTNSNIKFGFMPSTHAEVDAIGKIKNKKNKPKKLDIVVVRFTKSGALTESRPCYHCLCFMEKCTLDIRDVYYSTSEGTIVKEKLSDMKSNPVTCVSSGMRNLRCWKGREVKSN
jgi:cytidine deaminase